MMAFQMEALWLLHLRRFFLVEAQLGEAWDFALLRQFCAL
jgi:hypothetical protein